MIFLMKTEEVGVSNVCSKLHGFQSASELADRWVSHDQRGGSPTVFPLSFLDRSHYVFLQVAPRISS
jgi:hypothetical protein